MTDFVELKNIKHSLVDENIINWHCVSDDENEGEWRLYFKPMEDCGSGFYFYSVEWAGNDANKPTWSPTTYINSLYYGIAYFDGLRHVYLGADDGNGIYGYANYPDALIHIEIWKTLLFLESKYCRERAHE